MVCELKYTATCIIRPVQATIYKSFRGVLHLLTQLPFYFHSFCLLLYAYIKVRNQYGFILKKKMKNQLFFFRLAHGNHVNLFFLFNRGSHFYRVT